MFGGEISGLCKKMVCSWVSQSNDSGTLLESLALSELKSPDKLRNTWGTSIEL